jgi:hypothetical protein
MIRIGDFIQKHTHFGDIYFEVISSHFDEGGKSEFFVAYVSFDKYASRPRSEWTVGRIRSVISAEMAEPVMQWKRLRYHAVHGQYDPIYGYAPLGTPLRQREDHP